MSTVWIVQTEEPGSRIVAVFASRAGLTREYPQARPYTMVGYGHGVVIYAPGGDGPLYGREYPLHEDDVLGDIIDGLENREPSSAEVVPDPMKGYEPERGTGGVILP